MTYLIENRYQDEWLLCYPPIHDPEDAIVEGLRIADAHFHQGDIRVVEVSPEFDRQFAIYLLRNS